ncbi:MAG: hypothetical protein JWL77_6534 [Chthonomonadaceae bacterium]|jgi:hypothetical protein|nr:hypothetical protein [Chthonomonadaceae bacterium]
MVFGKPAQNNGASPPRKAAADVARIEGGGLVQVIVTRLSPLTFFLFLNDQEVSQIDVDSLSIDVEVPVGGSDPIVRATLYRYVTGVTGGKTQQHQELFPCTIEVIALGRRLSITCMNPNSLDGLWVTVGLRPDGTGSDLTGLQSVRLLLSQDLLDAKITWEDGESENLLPQ